MPKLVCTLGPDKGSEFLVDAASVLIGRSLTCDVQLEDEACSREHCRITRQGQYFAVQDLGSHNGTFLNQHRLTSMPVVLRDGDTLSVGDSDLAYRESLYGTVSTETAVNMTGPGHNRQLDELLTRAAGGHDPTNRPPRRPGILAWIQRMFRRD